MTDISQIPQKKQKLVSSFKEFSSFIQPKIKKNIPERVFPNSVNSFNTSGSLTARKTKTVFLELKNKKTLEIQINVSEEKELTVGWLLSESLRKMKEYYDSKNSLFPNENEILFLTSKDKNCNLDHWLTFMNRSISLLKDGQILTPFLSDFSFKTNEAMEKINLNYFHFVKIIGLGGFSTVILGNLFQS